MENSYCGKNCGFCITRTEGKCIGCRPEVHVPLHQSIYISSTKKVEPSDLLPDSSMQQKQPIDKSVPVLAEELMGQSADPDNMRFSRFCSVAICCRNKEIDCCSECQKTFACEKYAQKSIMNTIISSKMEAWGMTDHGLKKAVPFLYILLICFILEALFSFSTINPSISVIFLFISLAITGVRAYGYYRLRSFNSGFLTVTALTVAYIFSTLFLKLLDTIDYGVIGTILTLAAVIVQLASSILCYKISFDAYAELVSSVDSVLESRWLKLWRLTIILYIIAFIVALINLKNFGVSGFILCFGVALAILNIITFILMLATIKICSND